MNALRRYLLPGFVFQSVVIAGGYGTGRELAEFFLSRGPLGGLLAMALATAVWSAVCIVSYEFARVFRAFEYRSFFQRLLGPWWVAFEVLYVALMMIVLAVIAAAAGSIAERAFGLPYLAGVVGILVLVGFLVFGGNRVIERAFTAWSAVLYLVYIVFFVLCVRSFGPAIEASLAGGGIRGNWILGGLQYAGYNLGALPAVLITIRHHRSRRDTFIAGLLTGPIAMVPALLFLVAIAGEYPQILTESIPVNHMLEMLGSRGFQVAFQVVLFGTLAETGAGLLHAVNERIARSRRARDRELPVAIRVGAALAMLGLGAVMARFGLIPLVARGYGYITYGYLAVFVLPVLTWGVVLVNRNREGAGGEPRVR
ncbi:MAG: hypothetical protein OXQ94_01125 [Gemmatimonadota bacterium]|nr:hypothetical protein [Gemmatimonadota bacterium]MDE2870280.1 hypothetical protein [Gemmatimonadota bacterium]